MVRVLDPRSLAAATQQPKGLLADRLFFFDDAVPHSAFNVRHVYAPVSRLPVRFEGADDLPGAMATFASSIVALEGGGYRLYATCVLGPSEARRGEIRVWESEDGLDWQRLCVRDDEPANRIDIRGVPGDTSFMVQPQIVPLRDGGWRMYVWRHRDGQLRYLVAESTDGIEWTVTDAERPALYHPHDGGLWAWAQGLAQEPMGEAVALTPEQIMARKRRSSNDATYVYYNPQLDRYECYSVWLHPAIPDRRVEEDNAPGVHRLLQRRVSVDGLEWSDAELVLMPDERDPWDLQFYYMAMQWHRDWMIASVGHYRVEAGQQTQDLQLCFSRDGRTWKRPVRGGFIPRTGEDTPDGWGAGERVARDTGPPAQDSAGIYAPNAWLPHSDGWLILYSATPDPHNKNRGRTRILGAVTAADRFVGLAAGRTRGGFLSEPFILSKPEVRLDAAVRGWLRAELCDGFGRKLEGYHLDDSDAIAGDSSEHVLRWHGRSAEHHRYASLRLRVEMIDAEVYGIAF